jgi:hypothetical protein
MLCRCLLTTLLGALVLAGLLPSVLGSDEQGHAGLAPLRWKRGGEKGGGAADSYDSAGNLRGNFFDAGVAPAPQESSHLKVMTFYGESVPPDRLPSAAPRASHVLVPLLLPPQVELRTSSGAGPTCCVQASTAATTRRSGRRGG